MKYEVFKINIWWDGPMSGHLLYDNSEYYFHLLYHNDDYRANRYYGLYKISQEESLCLKDPTIGLIPIKIICESELDYNYEKDYIRDFS
jgi:hypothetical protein